ncbi:sulfite exporter TauE/SafE family protein [Mesorhizobium xinjiangense]|uniref:sulfite exporter TauE/SafE family protein n=1 Tax=Mesorhizobium xinjiangense TaxID=2678685 RepID=UPI0012ED795D|nr:sulfite exporter TauE/SafE family protein [Mesorhizobium xinjiangense]
MEADSLVLTFIAIAIGSLLKGITGLGLPVVALPVLSYFVGLPHAIGVLIMPILITNLHQSIQTGAALRDVTFLWPAILTGALGLGAGTWFLTVTSPDKLNVGLGLMLIFYICLRVFNPQFSLSPRTAARMSPSVGFLGGFAQGATGLCAAVIVPFVQSIRLERVAIIFTISTIFLIFAVIQFLALLSAGLLRTSYILEGVLALVPVAIFMPLGTWVGRRISREAFDRVFLVILAAIAVGLITNPHPG